MTQHLQGRKASAFLVSSLLILTAGIILPAAVLSTVVTGLVSVFLGFVGAHAATDIKSSKPKEGEGS